MSEDFIYIVGLIIIGSSFKKLNLLPKSSSEVLNSFVVNISFPAMIITSIAKLNISADIIYPVSMHWMIYIIHFFLILFLGKKLKMSKSIIGCLLVVSCLGNTAFLGIPMTHNFFGEDAIPYAILYDQLGSFTAFVFTMSVVLPHYSGNKAKSIVEILIRIIKFPPFIALILGFVFLTVPLPKTLDHFFMNISKTLIPCAMISIGFQMKYRIPLTRLKPIIIGLGLKLVIIPLLALGLYSIYGHETLALKVSVFQSGMPPMVTAGVLAMSSNLESDIAAALVGHGLLLSFLTLPILHLLI